MSDNIPYEIQVEIFKRLPLKSLIQLRSVSKAWKSLIDSSDFVSNYRGHVQHIFVCSDGAWGQEYVLVADDNFSLQQIPRLLNWFKNYSIIGCSHGLLCLYGDYQMRRGGHNSPTSVIVLWNLSIGKAVAIIVPNARDRIYNTTLGIGVCRENTDPKLVKIRYFSRKNDVESISCIPWQVEVSALSTGVWRSPYGNLPWESIKYGLKHVVVDGFLYWLATDWITMDELIISFDLTTEEFKEVNLPDSLAHANSILQISKLRNSLVLFERDLDVNDSVYIVWMMEDGVSKSFTKLFTVNVNARDASILGFSSAPIVYTLESEYDWALLVYEPCSKQSSYIWGGTIDCSCFVCPYMETLLLIDQPDLMVYNDISNWRVKNKRFKKYTS